MAVLDFKTRKPVEEKLPPPEQPELRGQLFDQAAAQADQPQLQGALGQAVDPRSGQAIPAAQQQQAPGVQNIVAPALQQTGGGVPNIVAPALTPDQLAQQEEPGFFGSSIIEPLATVASGALAVPVSGIAGPIGSLFTDSSAVENIKAIQDFITIQPETEAGKRGLKTVGDLVQSGVDVVNFPLSGLGILTELLTGQGVDQAVQTAEDIRKKGFGKTIGQRAFEETDSPVTGTFAEVLPEALMEILPLKGVGRSVRNAPQNVAKRTELINEQASAREARKAAEETGIDLFKFQQTLNPTDIERGAFLAELPETAARARESLTRQNQQVANAVDEFLGELAPPASALDAAPKFRSAAEKAVKTQENIRKQKAAPIYKRAFKEGSDVDITPVKSLIKDTLNKFPEGGEVAKSLGKVSNLLKGRTRKIQGEKVEVPPPLEVLHGAKVEIDQMLAKVTDGALGNTTKAQLVNVKDALLKQIDEASPAYKEARAEFARQSPNVDKIRDSIIGRVSTFNDIQLRDIAKNVFDPRHNQAVINQARKAINETDPTAWNALVRSEMERRLGLVKADLDKLSSTAAKTNVPAQVFNKLIGTGRNKQVLRNSLSPEQKKNFDYLTTVLERASKGRPGGSPTAIRGEVVRELRGPVRAMFQFLSSPLTGTATLGEAATFNKRARALADTLFDPTYKVEMKKIRDLPPNSEKAATATTKLLETVLAITPAVTETLEQQTQTEEAE